jgi:oxygen-independent coproporphyrinogen-3 oxidase
MPKDLSLYIHIPFCEKRCGYCDFVSCCELHKIDSYIETLCNEIASFPSPNEYTVKTIYIGGGTPSVLSPRQITAIFDAIKKTFIICGGAEISCECNPNSLSAEKLKCYKKLGINRISIGVQSFDGRILARLERLHTAAQAAEKIKEAGRYFNNISCDLIVGVPNETACEIPPEVLDIIKHISVYSLMRGDKIVCEKAIKFKLPAFHRYEVSNFAKSGYECAHNKVYWHGGEYVGFGAAAHSLLGNIRYSNTDDIDEYIAGRGFRTAAHRRTPDEIRTEQIMLGLRTTDGISYESVSDKTEQIEFLQRQKLIKIKNGRIIATAKGFRLLNQIIYKLN